MTISNFRAHEALYVVIVRDKNAEQLLKEWARENRADVSIENNRMRIFESQSFSKFQMSWQHAWDNVTIWDAWNKRHIWLD